MPTRGEGEGANRAQAIQILAFAHILAFGSQAYRSFSWVSLCMHIHFSVNK